MIGVPISAVNSWGSPLTRLAYGYLFIVNMASAGEIDIFRNLQAANNEFSFDSLPAGIVTIIMSLVFGAVCVSLGTVFSGSPVFSEKSRVRRAYRVGETGNTLLAKYLSDGEFKFELAAGGIGLIIFSTSVTLWNRLLGGTFIETGASESTLPGFTLVVVFLLVGYAISWSSKETLLRIDALLDDRDRLNRELEK